jgi:hypothetical protein
MSTLYPQLSRAVRTMALNDLEMSLTDNQLDEILKSLFSEYGSEMLMQAENCFEHATEQVREAIVFGSGVCHTDDIAAAMMLIDYAFDVALNMKTN